MTMPSDQLRYLASALQSLPYRDMLRLADEVTDSELLPEIGIALMADALIAAAEKITHEVLNAEVVFTRADAVEALGGRDSRELRAERRAA